MQIQKYRGKFMKSFLSNNRMKRRQFCGLISQSGIALAATPLFGKNIWSQSEPLPEKPITNIHDALKYPRHSGSMPGKYPGSVVEVYHSKALVNNKPDLTVTNSMLERGILELTGERSLKDAWHQFVSPRDRIGLKVNPVAGKLLSTSLELAEATIQQLQKAGIPRKNIIIWDRRLFQLHDVGFNNQNFPGIKIVGTEIKDKVDSFYNSDGKLYSEQMIDKDWFYYADCEMNYDADTLPYMVNDGKNSYFTKIVTQQLDKIINIPILKNAGSTVTLCMKNLAYGTITNTARLHQDLWSETVAQVPCFPPLRDKVILNIVDGLKGCYQGGPGANPQFITAFNRILLGSDPVAVDRIGYEIVLKKRMKEKVQNQESPRGTMFMELASSYKLGISEKLRIIHQKFNLSS
jgi:hypothetical protein